MSDPTETQNDGFNLPEIERGKTYMPGIQQSMNLLVQVGKVYLREASQYIVETDVADVMYIGSEDKRASMAVVDIYEDEAITYTLRELADMIYSGAEGSIQRANKMMHTAINIVKQSLTTYESEMGDGEGETGGLSVSLLFLSDEIDYPRGRFEEKLNLAISFAKENLGYVAPIEQRNGEWAYLELAKTLGVTSANIYEAYESLKTSGRYGHEVLKNLFSELANIWGIDSTSYPREYQDEEYHPEDNKDLSYDE